MKLDIISYHDLTGDKNQSMQCYLLDALLDKGIVGISNVPEFKKKSRAYVAAAIQFTNLNNEIKRRYAPHRDAGETEGYELGAEWFKNADNKWLIDDKKASFYAFVPDDHRNKWPTEVNLKTSYLELGTLIFETGKVVLNSIGLNQAMGLSHENLIGYGRMLHYHKVDNLTNNNPNWCGAHFDHGLFTGLMPAYYFHHGQEVDEPLDAGLYISRNNSEEFEKISVPDKSIMLFQVGELGQLLTNDRIQATKHLVKKTHDGIERFAFALFYSVDDNFMFKSKSTLIHDQRYSQNQSHDGSMRYGEWQKASLARYRAV